MGKDSSSPSQRSNQCLREESSLNSTRLNFEFDEFPRLPALPSNGASGDKNPNPSFSNQKSNQENREKSTPICLGLTGDLVSNLSSSTESGIENKKIGPRMNWSSMFPSSKSSIEDRCLDFQSSVVMEGNKGVDLSSKKFEEQTKKCEHLVIGFFVGPRLSFSLVQDAVTKLWKLKSEVRISIHGDNAFVFNFVNEEDRRVSLEQGAFCIDKKLFFVRPWCPLIE